MRDAIRMSIDHLHDKAKRDKKVIIVSHRRQRQRQHGDAGKPGQS